MEKSDVVGILFRHGDDDFSLWQPESDPYFADFLEKHETDGSSVRGNSAEILSEVRGAWIRPRFMWSCIPIAIVSM